MFIALFAPRKHLRFLIAASLAALAVGLAAQLLA